ncbi:hypothetical protein [Nocardioides sp. 616]|uniref:hypothetical protein n=1 Tax=Nocardioides sp. 616 TaxID=2268090 RepID=UPI0013B3F34B|nr:hypothetical protein [Nocardioides sp. 616]
MTRTLLLLLAALGVIAAIGIPLAVQAWDEEDADPTSVGRTRDTRPVSEPTPPVAEPTPVEEPPSTEPSGAGDAIPFGRFPLDLGWAEIHGQDIIDGPSFEKGGSRVFMPEGHCREGVLYRSGFQDQLATHVWGTDEVSRTRQILGFESADAARATIRALRDAVASCAVFHDAYTDKFTYTAEVFESIDESNARAGTGTFTFAYTASGSDVDHPFGVLYQFAVVDDIFYGSNQYGPWTADMAGDAVTILDRENAALIPLLSRLQR